MDEEYKNLRVPTLTYENHEGWFHLQKTKLQGKGIYYIIEETKYDFAWIKRVTSATTKTIEAPTISELGDTGVDGLTSTFERLGGTWNKEKAKTYDQDQAKALYILLISLSTDDQALIDEYPQVKDVWTQLKVKYEKTNATTADFYITKLHEWKFDEEKGIDAMWAKLKEYRHKIISADINFKSSYPDKSLFTIFTTRLPKSTYKPPIDSLCV
jgi:LTR polyprotein gag-polypeptide-like protein